MHTDLKTLLGHQIPLGITKQLLSRYLIRLHHVLHQGRDV